MLLYNFYFPFGLGIFGTLKGYVLTVNPLIYLEK